MKYHFLHTLALLSFCFLITSQTHAQNPVVSNVRFEQRKDGTHIVDIYYDVTESTGKPMTVTIKASEDNGATWDYAITKITGDIGQNISSGTNKHVVWDFAAEHVNTFGSSYRIKIVANNGIEIFGLPCPGLPSLVFRGKIYNTVLIGEQCWLKENLDIGTMLIGDQDSKNNGIIEKYCYENKSENCFKYGGLYQWEEAVQYDLTGDKVRGICPAGWHIPSMNELKQLGASVGENSNNLKVKGLGTWTGVGTNESGFSDLFEGFKNYNDGTFTNLGLHSFKWSSTQVNQNYSSDLQIYNNDNLVDYAVVHKKTATSVRCVKDGISIPEPITPTLLTPEDGAVIQPTSPTFKWNSSKNSTSYRLQISNDSLFVNLVYNKTGLIDTLFQLQNLSSSTTYYWRVSAANLYTTSEWSNKRVFITDVLKFVCGNPITYEGKTYNTVLIGNQCWLKENLNVGTIISKGQDAQNNGVIEKYCYNSDANNCNTYGGLYQWEEALSYSITEKTRGICPENWHIPSSPDFAILISAVNSNGNSLKAVGQGSGNGAGTNQSGFSGLLGGLRHYIGVFVSIGQYANFWSSTGSSITSPDYLKLNNSDNSVTIPYNDKKAGLSIRCIHD